MEDIKKVRLKIDLSATFFRIKSISNQIGIRKLTIKTGVENILEKSRNQTDLT